MQKARKKSSAANLLNASVSVQNEEMNVQTPDMAGMLTGIFLSVQIIDVFWYKVLKSLEYIFSPTLFEGL